ncbi:MAG TPA: hypothetical protein VFB21_09235 [Chthonomonadaceae bacterium]|nr:hypothetical protein [Chthonomonadaceae bacterium]
MFHSRTMLALSTVLLGLLLGLAGARSALAQAAAFTSNLRFPLDGVLVFVPSANGGAGETVALNGELHDLFRITIDARGGVKIKGHDNPQGVSGVGDVSGCKYQGNGVTQFETNAQVGVQSTFINNFHVIGQGPGNNFLVHATYHITVNADGTVKGYVDSLRVVSK